MARWLKAKIVASHLAILNGPGVGSLVVEITGRPPRWSRSLAGWATQERTCADVIALAASRSYTVEVIDERQAKLVDLSPVRTGERSNPAAFEPQLELGLG